MRFTAAFFITCALAHPQSVNWQRLPYVLDPGWPKLPAGWTFEETPGVAVSIRHHIFVFHRGPHSIMEFDEAGNMLRTWGDGVFVRPHALRFDREGNLWAVDDMGHIVVRMDYHGRVTMVLGRKNTKGETNELFNRPTDVAFGANGDIYVTDGYGNSRVVKFDRNGKFLTTWGKKGTGEGEFNTPHAIVVDNRGRVIVGDRENYRAQVFDANGKFLAQWKHVGSPWGLALTYDQTLYMSDGHNNRVLRMTTDGDIIGQIGEPGKLPGQFDFAHHIGAANTGEIYVAEIKNWRVQKFMPPDRAPKEKKWAKP